ncbi:MAG: hypothetical protein KBD23_04680 [Gammaproteobacteria bacterium]|nr:hypothetical protein [Gammaproteobacteria bacterium]MBP9729414.1 hypothetical protein [Gammaproteobacteria bacterium]
MEIHYKQFRAKIYFSAETDSFYGEVLEVPWLVSFQAKDLQEARVLMIEAIEHYLVPRPISFSE